MSKPYYADEWVTVHHQPEDGFSVLASLPDASVDAVVTDPPYLLGFMGRAWDSHREINWHERWTAECLRVLKPGGHLLAFGGSRTWHRLAVAIEDAGFEVRDSIAWLYGSGFPKSLDVSKAIDKMGPPGQAPFAEFAAHYETQRKAKGLTHAQVCAAGGWYGTVNHGGSSVNWANGYGMPTVEQWAVLQPLLDLDDRWSERVQRIQYEREVLGIKPGTRLAVAPGQDNDRSRTNLTITAAGSEDAARWQGWGTALKPAFEPIVVARKPLVGTVAANVLAHGTGALNIDGCRVGREEGDRTEYGRGKHLPHANTTASLGKFNEVTPYEPHAAGRWPANVVLDESQAAVLDEQSGETVSNVRVPSGKDDRGVSNTASQMVMRRNDTEPRGVADSGGASRYFAVIPTEENPCTDTTTPAASAPTPSATGAPDATHAPATTTSGASSVADSGVTTELPIDLMAERFRYVAKADASERPFIFRPTCECEDAWPTHTPSPARATGATTEPASSSTSKSGSATTGDSSPRATRSTTSTGTSSTTTPTTSSQSPRPTTSASTPAANSETASGGSLADSAVSSSRSASLTGISAAKGGRSTDDAARATSRAWSKTSVCGNCGAPARREAHATVKPLALMRWLVRLVTPPGGTVLEPFAGSGTTVEACLLEGFHCIAIEREADYLPLIVQRINRRRDPVAAVKSAGDDGGLFDLLDEEGA